MGGGGGGGGSIRWPALSARLLSGSRWDRPSNRWQETLESASPSGYQNTVSCPLKTSWASLYFGSSGRNFLYKHPGVKRNSQLGSSPVIIQTVILHYTGRFHMFSSDILIKKEIILFSPFDDGWSSSGGRTRLCSCQCACLARIPYFCVHLHKTVRWLCLHETSGSMHSTCSLKWVASALS